MKTGKEVYVAEQIGLAGIYASPVAANGHLYITNEEGHSYVLALGRAYKLLAENELGETVMATPAISDGRIYIRTRSTLYSFGRQPQN